MRTRLMLWRIQADETVKCMFLSDPGVVRHG